MEVEGLGFDFTRGLKTIKRVVEHVVTLFFKVIFVQKYIKIIFFILKKLFLTSAHQNDLKIQKIIIWSIEKNKINLNFFESAFKTQQQTSTNCPRSPLEIHTRDDILCHFGYFIFNYILANLSLWVFYVLHFYMILPLS